MSTSQTDVREIARAAMKTALAKGAREAAATFNRSRNVSLEWRDGKVEKINEATTRGLTSSSTWTAATPRCPPPTCGPRPSTRSSPTRSR